MTYVCVTWNYKEKKKSDVSWGLGGGRTEGEVMGMSVWLLCLSESGWSYVPVGCKASNMDTFLVQEGDSAHVSINKHIS